MVLAGATCESDGCGLPQGRNATQLSLGKAVEKTLADSVLKSLLGGVR